MNSNNGKGDKDENRKRIKYRAFENSNDDGSNNTTL